MQPRPYWPVPKRKKESHEPSDMDRLKEYTRKYEGEDPQWEDPDDDEKDGAADLWKM